MANKKEFSDEDGVSKKDDKKTIPDDGMRKMNRRRFLGTMTAIGGTAVLGKPKSSFASKEFEGWPNRYGMLVDTTVCVGCRSCEKACNGENNLPKPEKSFDDGSVFQEERRTTHETYTVVNQYENPDDPGNPFYRKIQCMHCNEPACATACPIHAYTKTKEGATLYDEDKCFGCRYCMTACPFGIPAYDYWSAFEPKIVKCTFCYDRIKEGQPTACAGACPSGALTFGRRDDLINLARSKILKNPTTYIDHIYGEHEVGGTSWLYLSGIPFEQIGLPTNIPNRPLIEETKGFLSAVPVVFTVWPALFGMCYAALRHRDQADHENKGKEEEVEK